MPADNRNMVTDTNGSVLDTLNKSAPPAAPTQYNISRAQMQDLLGTAQHIFGGNGYMGDDYQPFQNTKAVLGVMTPQEVIRQDFSTLKASTPIPENDLNMNQQEKNLYQHHMNNVMHGGFVQQGGGVSTIYNITADIGGKTYVIPTVWDGKIVPPNAAVERAKHIGLDNFPSYGSQEEADKRYEELHKRMGEDIKPLMQFLKLLAPEDKPGKRSENKWLSKFAPESAQAGEVVKLEGKNPYGILGMSGANVEQIAEQNKKNKTKATLMRALGGGADVLPIKPRD